MGRELLPLTRRLTGVLDDIEVSLQNPEQLNFDHLSIGLSEPSSGMDVISAFTHRNPAVQINARMGNSAELLALLTECRIDVAIVNSTDLDSRFYAVLNKANHLSVLLCADHPWARQESVHIDDLDGQPLIVRESGSTSRQHFMQVAANPNITPRIVLEFNSREGIKHAVSAGLGIGIVYEANMSTDESLVMRPIVGRLISAGQYIVCLPEYRESRMVQAFMDAAHAVRAGYDEAAGVGSVEQGS